MHGIVVLFPSLPVWFPSNVTATTDIYTLSLHDALPISGLLVGIAVVTVLGPSTINVSWALAIGLMPNVARVTRASVRSEEHTSELQSPVHLVCRLLLEKKKMYTPKTISTMCTSSQ